MRTLAGAATLTAAALVLTACGSSINSGTVVSRQFTPGHYYTWQMPVYRTQCVMEPVSTGSSTTEEDVCTQALAYYLPEQSWQPDEWQLQLKAGGKTGWIDVTQLQYNRAKLGQHWGGKS